ncbi:hypothetical protein [Pseudidiomarina woesei]|uniref:Uncharacterized protein n=1 Tax=Pseudidiomarina woesei TaxID=1381080 RepID=A0A0K6HAP4_9GAMM|nr:hypothetical protein [Pseudidiomarina woesei]CUA88044.1 hypothetical protein Ga0061064_2042 [Pseudidiomarina woesei]
MKSNRNWLWIVAGLIAVVFFADEIFAIIGAVLGLIFSVGFTGLLILAIAAVGFFVAMAIGLSVGAAVLVSLGVLVFALFGWLWPYILVGVIIYLLVRDRPKTV